MPKHNPREDGATPWRGTVNRASAYARASSPLPRKVKGRLEHSAHTPVGEESVRDALSLEPGSLRPDQSSVLALILRLYGPTTLREVWKTASERNGTVDVSSLRGAMAVLNLPLEQTHHDGGSPVDEETSSDSGAAGPRAVPEAPPTRSPVHPYAFTGAARPSPHR
ncbi:hypothetical protein [Streptomyces sp. NPDC050804]|uniref:hypothetical protein n=1 Tax=Streptomyces sp. NPDC050804 TaxID=3154745 RepID=UPI00343D4E1B